MNPIIAWYYIFNLFFRREKFVKDSVAFLWKNPEIQEIHAELWSTIYRAILARCYYKASHLAYCKTKVPLTYDNLYKVVADLLKENSNMYTCILYNDPNYWIYIISSKLKWVRQLNIPWKLEDQLKYIELKKKQFIADGSPGKNPGYHSLFENNIKEIMDNLVINKDLL